MFKHGHARDYNQSRLYNIWQNMKQRCYGKKHNSYLYKGINVCDAWIDSFVNFRDWALANGYENNLSIDRIDGTKDYCPENCRWTDRFGQQSNIKNNWIVKINGKEYCLSAAARQLKINRYTLRSRLVAKGLTSKDKPELAEFLEAWK